MKLKEILALVDDKREIRIGCQTGFVYIGQKKHFDKDKRIINKFYNMSIEDREVKELFPTVLKGGLGILITGAESTTIGGRAEYESWRENAKKRKKKDKQISTVK